MFQLNRLILTFNLNITFTYPFFLITIKTKSANICTLEKSIISVRIFDDADIELEDAVENLEAIHKIANGEKYCLLVDARVTVRVSPEARVHSAAANNHKNLIARAIIVNSLANKLVGNFLINYNKPNAPTKLFSEEQKALDWLKEHVVS